MKVLKFLLPLLVFAAIAVFLFRGLDKDPSQIPSPLIGKPAPAFNLPVLGTTDTFSPEQYRGKVWLLNIWGSWCAACLVEHPIFNDAARQQKLPLVGLAWKDKPANSQAWLARHGNPFTVVVSDVPGRAAIDYGVYVRPKAF